MSKQRILIAVIAVLAAAGAATGTYSWGHHRGEQRGYAEGYRKGQDRAERKADRPVVMPLLIPAEETPEALLAVLDWEPAALHGAAPEAFAELLNLSPSADVDDRAGGVSLAASLTSPGGCVPCVPQAEYARDLLAAGWPVEDARLRLYRDVRLRFDPAGTTQLGPADAPVVLTWWIDLQCPYCERSFPAIRALHEDYPEQLRIDVMHLPLRMHAEAEPAARATLAAGRQDAFLPMAAVLFEKRRKLGKHVPADGGVAMERLAARAGLDVERYRADYADEAWDDVLAAHREQAAATGVRAVPSVYIDGHKLRRFSEAVARDTIDKILAGEDPALAR